MDKIREILKRRKRLMMSSLFLEKILENKVTKKYNQKKNPDILF